MGTPSFNHAVFIVCDGYEELGEMVGVGVLSVEPVWSRFGAGARAWWILCKLAIEKMRQEWEDPALYEEFERLYRLIEEMDRERGISSPMPRSVHTPILGIGSHPRRRAALVIRRRELAPVSSLNFLENAVWAKFA